MKKLSFLALVFFNLSANATIEMATIKAVPIQYEDDEGRIIDALNAKKAERLTEKYLNKKKVYVPNFEKKKDFNPTVKVLRDDKTSLSLALSPDDRVAVDMCFNYPLRIVLDKNNNDKIKSVLLGDDKFLTVIRSDDKTEDLRSVFLKMLQPVADDEKYPTNVYIERDSDNRTYRFDLNLIKCPDFGEINFVQEIVVSKKTNFTGQPNVIPSEDLIIELTKGYPRKSKENVIDIHDGTPTTNSNFINLGMSMLILDDSKKNAKIQVIALNSLQNAVINTDLRLLEQSTKVMSKKANKPLLRFSLNVNVGKRYAMEWNNIYLLVIDHENKYYQTVKVPLKELYKKKELESYELNINE